MAGGYFRIIVRPEGQQRRRGLGGLTPEKKALLKKIIMDKVKEEMHEEAIRKKEQKERYIQSRLIPVDVKGRKDDDIKDLCREIQKQIIKSEGEKIDLEQKLAKQELDIHELTMKIQLRGKFAKPVLRKVKKSDTTIEKIRRKHQEQKSNQEGIIAELNHVEKPI